MKALWCIGLAACLVGRSAVAQVAWPTGDDRPHADPYDPDLVRTGVFPHADEALAEGARPTLLGTGDVDGDGRADDLLVVRPRLTPYPFDRRAGMVVRLHRADGYRAEVIARGIHDAPPPRERSFPEDWGPLFTTLPPLIFGPRMFPVLVEHRYHDRDPHGWWESALIVLHAPPSAGGAFSLTWFEGSVRRLSPMQALITSDQQYPRVPGAYREILSWDGRQLRSRSLPSRAAHVEMP
jgi:hypothetical protein